MADPYAHLTGNAIEPSSGPSTTIWLARHAEAHNPNHILYARLPRVRLSAEGAHQADALAAYLAERPLAAIYSSPMLRTRQTARRIAAAQSDPPMRVHLDRDLLEIGTSWQGATVAQLEAINWDLYDHPRSAGGETIQDIRDRMHRWLGRMLRRYAGQEIVGVSHGDAVLILLADLRGAPLSSDSIRCEPYIPTGCVFELRFDAATHTYQGGRLVVPHQAAAA